jgi:hypothetical protein
MVKCTKRQIRQLKTALHGKMPEAQRRRIQMILLRESGMAQTPALRAWRLTPSLAAHRYFGLACRSLWNRYRVH